MAAPVAKASIVIAIIGGVLYFKAISRLSGDFHICHLKAMDIVRNLDEGAFHLHYPPDVEHDQIDEYLHTCMLGKGYAYHPSAWKRCPTEKIATCYGPTLESEFLALFDSGESHDK